MKSVLLCFVMATLVMSCRTADVRLTDREKFEARREARQNKN